MWEVDRLPVGPGLIKRYGRLDVNFEDPRLEDRVDRVLPRPHAGTHEDGGTDELILTQAQITGLAAALALLAPLASPALTGIPTVPTATPGTATMQAASTAFVAAAINALVAAAPGALDTLDELAAALGDDANFAATVTAALAGKATAVHGHAQTDITGLVTDLAGKIAASLVDAKGDLLAGTAADTVTRVPVGADGTVLKADSAAAAGVSWGPSLSLPAHTVADAEKVLGVLGDGSLGWVPCTAADWPPLYDEPDPYDAASTYD